MIDILNIFFLIISSLFIQRNLLLSFLFFPINKTDRQKIQIHFLCLLLVMNIWILIVNVYPPVVFLIVIFPIAIYAVFSWKNIFIYPIIKLIVLNDLIICLLIIYYLSVLIIYPFLHQYDLHSNILLYILIITFFFGLFELYHRIVKK